MNGPRKRDSFLSGLLTLELSAVFEQSEAVERFELRGSYQGLSTFPAQVIEGAWAARPDGRD